MKKILTILGITTAAIFFILAIFINMSATKSNNKLDDIKKSGKIIMGCNANYPPFEFHKKINGEDKIVGFDILIGEEIAKDLEVELQITDMEFSSVLASLDTGIIDMALSGISKTKEREKSMDFSEVYYEPSNYLLVNYKDIGKYTSEKDIKNLTIGVQTSTTQEEIANNLNIKNIVSLPKTPDLIAQLNQGLIDGIIVEKCVGDNYEISNKNLKIEKSFTFESNIDGTAIGIDKDNEDLLKEINKTINRLKSEGKLEKFYNDSLKLSAE